MMDLKKYALLLSLFAILILALGCTAGDAGTDPVGRVWFGGDTGLIASYELETSDVYEDESFPITVLLENKGEHTIFPHEVELEIKGISPNDFTGVDFLTDNTEQVEKVSEYLPEGGYDIVHFGEALYQGLSGTFYDANVYVEYTYPYATYVAVPKVCFKYDIRDRRVCEVEGIKDAFASGAPIQIGTAKQRPAGVGKIYLEIPIVNKGTGRAKAYATSEFSNLYDEIRFEVETIGWTCTAQGDPQVARVKRGEGFGETVIRCKSDQLERGDLFTAQVDVTLSYFYQDLISERVRIKENPDLDSY